MFVVEVGDGLLVVVVIFQNFVFFWDVVVIFVLECYDGFF